MSGLPAAIVLLGCAVLAVVGIAATEIGDWRNAPRTMAEAPFDAAPLMDDTEKVMHQRLVSVLPECLVFAKVQLPGLVSVRPGHDAFAWYDKVSRLNVDFVVCLKDSSVVVAAVDLQTDEDLSRKAMRNFERKEQALNAAGITLLSWSALNLPDESEIRAAFTQ